MTDQILPVTGLDELGVIADTPSLSLPPNAFSGARNVRFRDGAVNKMEGEVNIFPDLIDTDSLVKYTAWWPNPNRIAEHSGYYLVVVQHANSSGVQMDHAYLVQPGDTEMTLKGTFQPDNNGNWQHTIFQGGFALIINQGIDVPHYILDPEGNTNINNVPNFAELPGWESYNVVEEVLDDTFTRQNSRIFDLGRKVDFAAESVLVEVASPGASYNEQSPVATTTFDMSYTFTGTTNAENFVPANLPVDFTPTGNSYSIWNDPRTNTTVLVFGPETVVNGTRVRVYLSSRERVHVRAGVVRSYGDFLVAANLVEVEESDNDVVVRRLPGVVRTSDAAAPGSIPRNWNPYAAGVSTANEFQTTQSGVVQDMVQLQGNLYIYAQNGIFVMPNPAGGVPSQPQPIAEGWGALTTHAVVEFDGAHFVVGSSDIYVFSGHPGNIQSVADGRMRNWFYDNLNPFHHNRVFVLRYQAKDEMWICFPDKTSVAGECNQALIWNYRKNNWTNRDLNHVVAGDIGPLPGGGVPTAYIDLDGVSGDNGVTNIGAWEVQGFLMDTDDALRGNHPGVNSQYTITVNNWPSHNFTGRPLFDFFIPNGFSTGATPPWMSFNFYDSANNLVYHFETQLPQNVGVDSDAGSTVVRDALKSHLEGVLDSDHVDIIETSDNPRELIFEVLDTDVTTASIRIGARTIFDRGTLVRNAAFDELVDSDHQAVDTETVSGWTYITDSIYISEDQIGTWFYPTFNPALPDGSRFLIATESAGDTLYERNNATELMYSGTSADALDRFHDQRPAIGSSFYMYRARSSTNNDSDLGNQAFIPMRAGVFDVQVRVPQSGYSLGNYTLQAYNVPDLTHTGTDLGLVTLDPTRDTFTPVLGPGQTLDTENIPPIVTFFQRTRDYNATLDTARTGRDGNGNIFPYDTDNTPNLIYVAFAGDYTGTNRNNLAAETIANEFHDDTTTGSYFNAVDNNNVATLTSRNPGVYQLYNHTTVGPMATAVQAAITIAEVNHGLWPITIGTPNPNIIGQVTSIYPTVTVTAPDTMQSWTATFNNGTGNTFTVRNQLDQLTGPAASAMIRGWSSLSLPPGYSFPSGDSDVSLIASVEHGTYDPANRDNGHLFAQRPVSGSFTFNIDRVGNVTTRTLWQPNFKTTRDTDITGYGLDSDMLAHYDFRGAYLQRATPSYLAFLIYNSAIGGDNLEYLIVEAGGRGDPEYNILTQAGTNFTQELPEPVAERWISEIRLAQERLSVDDRGTQGQFQVRPANYDDTANFVLEVHLNNNAASTARINEYLSGTIQYEGRAQRVVRNALSATPFINPYDTELRIASNSPVKVVDTSDTQINPSATRRPDRTTRETAATFTTPPLPDDALVFDIDRPWPKGEVNLNEYRPIFIAGEGITRVSDSKNVQVNKMIGADVGWTYPLYTIDSERTVDRNGVVETIRAGTNDAPQPYLSFVFRENMPISPEFETESIAGMAFWAEGAYKPNFFDSEIYNRLYLGIFGRDVPGGDMHTVATGRSLNKFYITEDYKADHRLNSRFLSILVGDGYVFGSDRNPATEVYEGKTFNQAVPWRLSGMQVKVMTGGKR